MLHRLFTGIEQKDEWYQRHVINRRMMLADVRVVRSKHLRLDPAECRNIVLETVYGYYQTSKDLKLNSSY